MATLVITIDAKERVFDAAKMMKRRGIGSLVVLHEGQLEGILTERDILTKIVAAGKDPKSTIVGKIMVREVKTVGPDASLLDVAKMMAENEFRHVVVVEAGKIAGILTSKDVLQFVAAN